MSTWQISNPPTEADNFKASGLFGADLDRTTRALDKLEARGLDRVESRTFLAKVATGGALWGADVNRLRDQGFDLDTALSSLPKYTGVDVWELIPQGRVPFWDVIEAIEVSA